MISNDDGEARAVYGERFFTLYKFFWWLVYNLMAIGFAASWLFVRREVLGYL